MSGTGRDRPPPVWRRADIDDAYITFRYARDIAGGLGFVYNPGQHVLGTTTPLYSLLLAILFRLTHVPLPSLSLSIAALSDGASTLLAAILTARACGNRFAAVGATLTFALLPASIFYAQSGMETSLFTSLLLLATWRSLEGDAIGWGLCAGLAILTRPEGLVFAFCIAVGDMWRTHRPAWLALLTLAVPTIAWAIWATWYFGSPIPLSVLTKAQTQLHVPWASGAIEDTLGALPFGAAHAGVGEFALIVAAILTCSRAPALRPCVAACLLIVCGWLLAVGHGALIFGWYPVPLLPFGCICLYVAIDLLRALGSSLPARLLPVLCAVILVLAQARALHYTTRGGVVIAPPSFGGNGRLVTYGKACRLLAPMITRGSVIAAPEVGAIGYSCGATILDTAGLVSPGLGSEAGDGAAGISAALIVSRRPDYVISLSAFADPSLLRSDAFRKRYRLLFRLPETSFGSHGLYVFMRQSRPVTPHGAATIAPPAAHRGE